MLTTPALPPPAGGAPSSSAPFNADSAHQDQKADYDRSSDHRREPDNKGHEGMNAPDRFELFTLEGEEKKCTEAADTRTPNSSTFTINKEDHTLANMLRAHLLKDPCVIFAGYKVPHPLFAKIELRVQTDGEKTPKEAVVQCCRALVGELQILSKEFTKEYELRKLVSGGFTQ